MKPDQQQQQQVKDQQQQLTNAVEAMALVRFFTLNFYVFMFAHGVLYAIHVEANAQNHFFFKLYFAGCRR